MPVRRDDRTKRWFFRTTIKTLDGKTQRLYGTPGVPGVIREGLVVRNIDGSAKSDDQADKGIGRICRRAKLPVRLFHTLRHSFGTHAALFGVNPWRLQVWLGHKRIDETMLYVHVAEAHSRDLPEAVITAGNGIADPDRRVLAMLGARGSHVAAGDTSKNESAGRSVA